MALSPTIPTSFVPRSVGPQRFRTDLSGAFAFVGYSILGASFVIALGVFGYGRVLATEQASKDKDLATAVSKIDSNTAESFIRLNDRLALSQSLMNNHVAFSGLFNLLDTIMPNTVRFTALHAIVDSAGVARIDGAGTAKSFNALAATSAAFANDGNIKDAIFSSIKVNRDNSVTFLLAAKLDPKLITFAPTPTPAPATPTPTP